MVEFSLREYEASDAAAVLQLNAESVAVLSPMDADRLQLLAGMASLHLVAVGPSGVIGFLMAFADGTDYDSVNYRWLPRGSSASCTSTGWSSLHRSGKPA